MRPRRLFIRSGVYIHRCMCVCVDQTDGGVIKIFLNVSSPLLYSTSEQLRKSACATLFA